MTDEERLAELLLDWEERYERGEDVSAAELCRDRPDLVPALAERIDRLRRMVWLTQPPSDAGAEPALELPSGVLDGRYRLDERIGEGGHGQVFRAFDLELQRQVAVKIPRPDFYRLRPDRRDAFVEEARRLAKFTYPGIVQVHDVRRHDGYDFIVSEWINGIDLAQLVSVCDVPRREAARVVTEAARHLHHAHEQGFIHRDVKPANILLRDDGRVVLADFGIAVQADEPGAATGATGTINYMAPERITGVTVADVRADVYGLGLVLFELLTGEVPFARWTGEQLRLAILQGLRLIELEHWYPQLTAICRKCTKTDPAARYQTAEEVAQDLERLLVDPDHGELDSWNDLYQPWSDFSLEAETDPRKRRRLSQAIFNAFRELGEGTSTDDLRRWVEEKGIAPTESFASIVPHVKRWWAVWIELVCANGKKSKELCRAVEKEIALYEQRRLTGKRSATGRTTVVRVGLWTWSSRSPPDSLSGSPFSSGAAAPGDSLTCSNSNTSPRSSGPSASLTEPNRPPARNQSDRTC